MRFPLRPLFFALWLSTGLAVAATPQATDKGKNRPVSQKAHGKAAVAKAKPAGKAHVAQVTSAHRAKTSGQALARAAEQWRESPHGLALQSAAALVFDQSAGDALFQKNAGVVAPIASITKLMTAMVVLDSLPDLQANVSISEEDVDTLRGSRSRLNVGSVLSRETALLLALMSSENRAAHALGRHYPGGLTAFVAAMNAKARSLGMTHSHFDDPTGLSSSNVSTANDLARMVSAAYRYPLIREWSTTSEANVEISGRQLAFRNTNPLVKSRAWDVGLSKTGYIHEAGKCLVMQARVAERPVVIVLLDSAGKQTRVGDANRIKRWMESANAAHKLPTHAATTSGRLPG